jgi:hypothetical protein
VKTSAFVHLNITRMRAPTPHTASSHSQLGFATSPKRQQDIGMCAIRSFARLACVGMLRDVAHADGTATLPLCKPAMT